MALTLGYETKGIAESVGDKMGFVRKQVKGDPQRFKRFIEERGEETGAWRGNV